MARTAAVLRICVPAALVAATCMLLPTAAAAPPAGQASADGAGRVTAGSGTKTCPTEVLDPAARIAWIRDWRLDGQDDRDVELLIEFAQTDVCEAVRYEAVRAIGNSLLDAPPCTTTVVCRPRPRGLIRRVLSHVFGIERRSVQYVSVSTGPAENVTGEPTCCDRDTRQALASIAAGVDRDGRPIEPSPRVRQAAVAALAICDRIGPCDEESLPPGPSDAPGHNPVPGEPFQIEEPPPGSAGFEPLASSDVPHAARR